MRYAPLLLFLSACSLPTAPIDREELYTSNTLAPRKQRQKIAAIQKKLELAEKQKERIAEEVDDLRRSMRIAQLNLIRRRVDDFDRELHKNDDPKQFLRKNHLDDLGSLFLSERELLHSIIQEGPSPSSFEAQVVLDQLLEIITRLSDSPPPL